MAVVGLALGLCLMASIPVPMGLAFGYWYARTGRLWPLVIAHVILDVAALARFA